jgi:hypothetical protein
MHQEKALGIPHRAPQQRWGMSQRYRQYTYPLRKLAITDSAKIYRQQGRATTDGTLLVNRLHSFAKAPEDQRCMKDVAPFPDCGNQ